MSSSPDSPAPSADLQAPWLHRLLHGLYTDFQLTARMLRKNKGFAFTALITLALCIGANTAIFSMLYALVIKPLPYREPTRIVEVYNSFTKVGLNKLPSNIIQYLDFKEHAPAFADLALWHPREFTLGEDGGPSRLLGVQATAGIFDVLGLRPFIGHFFTADNQVPGAEHVAVITESFWNAHFHGDPGVLGQTVRLDGEPYEIIGVAPHDFEAFDARARFVSPISWTHDQVNQMSRYGVSPRLYGRLKSTATPAEALAQVTGLEKQYYDNATPERRDMLDRSGHVIGLDTIQAQRTEPLRAAMFMLQGGVLFVLLIGCVNVANLLLARANARQGELAIRAALGAGRWVIARQLLMESTLLTWLGAILGVGLAWLALGASNRFIAQLMPTTLPFALDGRVLGYTALVAIVMSIAIGLLPIVHVLRGNLLAALHASSRSASGGRGVRSMSSILVVVQVAFALILLTGAGLLIHSFIKASAVDPGFDPRHVLAARVALPAKYRADDGTQKFAERLLMSLQEIPGATACLATATPFQSHISINAFSFRDIALPPGAAQPGAFHLGASPNYLEVMHIPLRAGRWFNESDTAKSRKVYVVDEHFAHRYFPDGNAIGQHLVFGAPPAKPEDWPEIVGVVGNVRQNGVEEHTGNPYLYHPLTQSWLGQLSVLIRTRRSMTEMTTLVRRKISEIDPELPVFNIAPMPEIISTRLDNRRAIMILIVSFAVVALLLSAIGIYGVLAYDVTQRTREIGIRGAVGATRDQIIMLILRQGLWKAVIGLAIGLVGAALLSRYLSSQLYEVQPTDPLAYVVVTALLLAVALLASYLPARRAARIDPMTALRTE